jgi:hypothetical protein
MKDLPLLKKRLSPDELHRAERMILVVGKRIERERKAAASSNEPAAPLVPQDVNAGGGAQPQL